MHKSVVYGVWLLILFTAGCSSKETRKEELVDKDADPILDPYFEIVDALSNDDFKAVQKAGMELYNVEASAGPKLALVRMGRLIVEAPSRLEQQNVFLQMGVVLPLYLEQISLHDFPIYKFRCTEVFDGKEGVWFSRTKESFNPYKGKRSKECIELTETIAPVKQIEE